MTMRALADSGYDTAIPRQSQKVIFPGQVFLIFVK